MKIRFHDRIKTTATVMLSVFLVVLSAGCPFTNPPQTADFIDIEQYMGLWYEIAKFPQPFQNGLVGVTAEYTLEDDGRVRIRNQGFQDALDGEESSIEGYASVVDEETNAKLRIRFDPFPVNLFPGNYWIIEVGDDYEYAIVSGPNRNTLWILSRTPSMDETIYSEIVSRLEEDGFDTNRLVKTRQDTSG